MIIDSLSWLDLLGYFGTALVILSSCMTTMIPLRLISIVSNIVFVVYALWLKEYPLFILNLAILPMNGYKIFEIKRITKKVKNHSASNPSFDRLIPLMHKLVLLKGQTLFQEGDNADRLFYVQSGVLEIEKLNLKAGEGDVLGEIGMFTVEHKRTATVVAKTDCVIYELTEDQVKQAYFLDPSLSFSILNLITQRLIENERRLKKLLNEQMIL